MILCNKKKKFLLAGRIGKNHIATEQRRDKNHHLMNKAMGKGNVRESGNDQGKLGQGLVSKARGFLISLTLPYRAVQ